MRRTTYLVIRIAGRRCTRLKCYVDASVGEQRRIGQDLHDGLCQDLVGIAFQAHFAAQQLQAKSLPEAGAVNKVAASIREAATQARRLSHGLNPVDVRGGGLLVALEGLAARISESSGIACTFQGDQAAQVDDDATATHIYRIAQEAVRAFVILLARFWLPSDIVAFLPKGVPAWKPIRRKSEISC